MTIWSRLSSVLPNTIKRSSNYVQISKMATVPTVNMLDGHKIPMIGLGTWMASNESELETALDTALEVGYRHIDTAFYYGNEHVIGRVLKRWFTSGKLKREDVFLTTKLPFQAIHADRVDMFMKKSLANFGLDYVDLYLIHFPVGINYTSDEIVPSPVITLDTSDHLELWKKMEEQVDAGRTKSIGLSNFNARQVDRIFKASRIKPACLEIELHVSMQQREIVSYCQKNNIVVIAYSPLGSPSYNKFLENIGVGGKQLVNIMENEVVKKIAKKHNKNASHILLRFLVEKKIVPIPKSVTPSRIRDNFKIFDFSLDASDLKELESLEIGEDARIVDFQVIPQLQDHQEWPWARKPKE